MGGVGSTFNIENWPIMSFSSTCSIKYKRYFGAVEIQILTLTQYVI